MCLSLPSLMYSSFLLLRLRGRLTSSLTFVCKFSLALLLCHARGRRAEVGASNRKNTNNENFYTRKKCFSLHVLRTISYIVVVFTSTAEHSTADMKQTTSDGKREEYNNTADSQRANYTAKEIPLHITWTMSINIRECLMEEL
jgi:hypothetical protein